MGSTQSRNVNNLIPITEFPNDPREEKKNLCVRVCTQSLSRKKENFHIQASIPCGKFDSICGLREISLKISQTR